LGQEDQRDSTGLLAPRINSLTTIAAVSEKKRDWSFYWWLAFLVMAFVSMVKEGVIVPNAYAAIIFAFGAGWSAANLKNKR
tara:strand:- start:41 stop:283 length:243 start_codon:yes stop_codon:yes gene_type:complete